MWIAKFNAYVPTKDGQVYSKPAVTATTAGSSINKKTILGLCLDIKASIPSVKNDSKFDSHLMKESEMGVVGLLAFSKYGNRDIKNKVSDTLTGGYNNISSIWNEGKSNSSTNNAYGVYDLIGGTSSSGYMVAFWWANQGTGAAGKPNPITGASNVGSLNNTEYMTFSDDSRNEFKGRRGGGAADLIAASASTAQEVINIGSTIMMVNLNQGNPFVLVKGVGLSTDNTFAKLFRSTGNPSNGNPTWGNSYFRPVVVVEH